MKVLGIDIGGSSVKGAPVDTATGRLLAPQHRIATPVVLKPKQEAEVIRELARHFGWKGPIGCGFPGVVHGGTIKFLGNLIRILSAAMSRSSSAARPGVRSVW